MVDKVQSTILNTRSLCNVKTEGKIIADILYESILTKLCVSMFVSNIDVTKYIC